MAIIRVKRAAPLEGRDTGGFRADAVEPQVDEQGDCQPDAHHQEQQCRRRQAPQQPPEG
jgi:hypothetical protein